MRKKKNGHESRKRETRSTHSTLHFIFVSLLSLSPSRYFLSFSSLLPPLLFSLCYFKGFQNSESREFETSSPLSFSFSVILSPVSSLVIAKKRTLAILLASSSFHPSFSLSFPTLLDWFSFFFLPCFVIALWREEKGRNVYEKETDLSCISVLCFGADNF